MYVSFLVGIFTGQETLPGIFWLIALAIMLAGLTVFFGYSIWWLITLRDGQTPGKKLVGLRVVNATTGETLGFWMMLVREFLVKNLLFISWVGPVTLGVLPLLDFLWPLWDANSQTLHDKIVGTQVVRN